MATLKIYYNPKRVGKKGVGPILIAVSHKTETSYIKTGISVAPSNYCNGKVVGLKNSRTLNATIDELLIQYKARLIKIENTEGVSRFTSAQLRDMLMPNYTPQADNECNNLFVTRYLSFVDQKSNEGTKSIYRRTLAVLRAFDNNIDKKTFEQIDKVWLQSLVDYLTPTNTESTISLHLRNIRAVFNDAIDSEITTFYPFRKFEIKGGKTNKLPFTIEQMRLLFSATIEDERQREWIDLARLIFLFIGINMADLAELIKVDKDGYIRYTRRKTGRQYAIKVEKEAMEIIDRWRGRTHLLKVFDRYKSYKNVNQHMVHAVKCLGLPNPPCKGGRGNKDNTRHNKARLTATSSLGDFCLYSLRRAWATIAFNQCDIPMEVVSMALGHSDGKGMSVTQRYVQFDSRKIDEANRKVLDFVLYNKEG